MDRRSFVRRLPVVAGTAAGLGAVFAGGCAGVGYVTPRRVSGGLAVSRDAVEEGGVFVTHPSDARPVFLSRTPEGAPVAVHARCTHSGCQPDAVSGRLVCPCHGSEFTLDGRVLEGPAREDLRRFDVRVEEDDWVIRIEGGEI